MSISARSAQMLDRGLAQAIRQPGSSTARASISVPTMVARVTSARS
jgi:hypothetical protein